MSGSALKPLYNSKYNGKVCFHSLISCNVLIGLYRAISAAVPDPAQALYKHSTKSRPEGKWEENAGKEIPSPRTTGGPTAPVDREKQAYIIIYYVIILTYKV